MFSLIFFQDKVSCHKQWIKTFCWEVINCGSPKFDHRGWLGGKYREYRFPRRPSRPPIYSTPWLHALTSTQPHPHPFTTDSSGPLMEAYHSICCPCRYRSLGKHMLMGFACFDEILLLLPWTYIIYTGVFVCPWLLLPSLRPVGDRKVWPPNWKEEFF